MTPPPPGLSLSLYGFPFGTSLSKAEVLGIWWSCEPTRSPSFVLISSHHITEVMSAVVRVGF